MLREPDPHVRMLDRALAGRYVLERRLGRGGTGVVFLARELRLDRPVAIKLLDPPKAGDPIARRRFLGEARTAAQLSHPNTVPVFAVDESPDAVFFVMAYVEGQTLGQRIRDQEMLPPEEGARLLREVARALAHAHERGVVHRDVKPDNILLDAATGRALVFDFGIARVGGDGGSTGSGGGVVGTADYMSPEQASGLGVDARSDLYSLGVVATTRCRAGCRSTPPTAMRCWRGTSRSPRRRSRRSHRMCRAVWRRWWIAVSTKSRRPASRAASISPKRSASRLRRLRGHPSPCGPSWWRAAIGLLAPGFTPISAQLAAFSTGGAVALLAAVVARARTEHRTDPKGERRLRFWAGPLGRWLVRLGGRRTPSAPAPAPHRP